MTTRVHYADRLEELKLSVARMAGVVQEAVGKATQAIVQRNDVLAGQVIGGDQAVDKWEDDIERQCTQLIATEQPVAGDLRTIVAALAIGNDLERVGDYAVHLANVASKMSTEMVSKAREEIVSMADIAVSMIRDFTKAFLEEDCDLALDVMKRDDQVDGIYARFFQEVLKDMVESKSQLQEATAMLFCAKYLERLADHINNVCEEVVYVCTGKKYIG
jgi:phosphate transport system protein